MALVELDKGVPVFKRLFGLSEVDRVESNVPLSFGLVPLEFHSPRRSSSSGKGSGLGLLRPLLALGHRVLGDSLSQTRDELVVGYHCSFAWRRAALHVLAQGLVDLRLVWRLPALGRPCLEEVQDVIVDEDGDANLGVPVDLVERR